MNSAKFTDNLGSRAQKFTSPGLHHFVGIVNRRENLEDHEQTIHR